MEMPDSDGWLITRCSPSGELNPATKIGYAENIEPALIPQSKLKAGDLKVSIC
jgi:hypothetical protein